MRGSPVIAVYIVYSSFFYIFIILIKLTLAFSLQGWMLACAFIFSVFNIGFASKCIDSCLLVYVCK